MKWLIIVVMLFVGGCMPASQQEVQELTDLVNQIVPSVREAVSNSSEDTKQKVEVVLGQVEKINEAVAKGESPMEIAKQVVTDTASLNPYATPILAGLGIAEAIGIYLEKRKRANLEKGVNRVKGEAEPDLAKKIHDTIKIYTG